MESATEPPGRSARTVGLLLIALLLWLLLQPVADSGLDLDRRRAKLEEAIRVRDELPPAAPSPISIAAPVSVLPAILADPPLAPPPAPLKQQPLPQDAYKESVLRYLRNMELRQYDELARRKESFDQKMLTESARIARQIETAANSKAPPPRMVLSAEVKSRLSYCIRCHERRDPVELAEMFSKAGDFH